MIFFAVLFVLAAGKPEDSEHDEFLLSLNKELLRSTEVQDSLPNPSVHIALRLSPYHNLIKESQYLNLLQTKFHQDIQNSLNEGKPVVGRLALYMLALKSSCVDVGSLTLTEGETSSSLLTHLKRQTELEKEHITISHRPITNYYQYSLGILTLCVSGVKVSAHVSHKLIHTILHRHLRHGDAACSDCYGMAGMALQCLKEAETPVKDVAELNEALSTIKQRLMNSENSSGVVVQALVAMGSQEKDYSTLLETLRSEARQDSSKNPMAISQMLPALQRRSYLQLKIQDCCNEDDSLVVDDVPVVEVLPSSITVEVEVEVVKADGIRSVYRIKVPEGSSLLEVLNLLQQQQQHFTFGYENSLWGPFLSLVNGEQARQGDRRYWHLASDGKVLTQGIKDYTITWPQKITIRNTGY